MVTTDELITSHLNLANSVAWERKLTYRTFNIDELQSAAYFGLVIAAEKFDESLSHFPRYARIKIEGAIGDYIREVRGRTHKFESMNEETCDSLTQLDSYENILNQIIENLSKEGKNIMLMYYLEGLSLKEISVKLGIVESTASRMLAKCRQQIQDEYKE